MKIRHRQSAQDVLIIGDRITEIGAAGEIKAPEGGGTCDWMVKDIR